MKNEELKNISEEMIAPTNEQDVGSARYNIIHTQTYRMTQARIYIIII